MECHRVVFDAVQSASRAQLPEIDHDAVAEMAFEIGEQNDKMERIMASIGMGQADIVGTNADLEGELKQLEQQELMAAFESQPIPTEPPDANTTNATENVYHVSTNLTSNVLSPLGPTLTPKGAGLSEEEELENLRRQLEGGR
eukprot:Trichotokara_eunicae@DN3249_c0_g1_i2.p1